ncbi:MAG: ZPR1 zinc finger domain-containing protein [Promethearchaeota archaeon]|jgi:zinc finger protein|nr:MAG: ZPR1 zinc finger domain-containing protein [Candidatus Lokiarchaeota archaeon]
MSEKAKKSEKEFSFQCPVCKKGIITIQKTVYDLPDKDKMLIIKFECNTCNYSNNDIIPLTTNFKPGVISLKVKDEIDLKSKVYRSPVGKLEIPELELAVEPGPSANFYYTNVEGILLRFENAVSIYKNNLDNDDPQIDEIEALLENIQKAIEGKFEFTLKISDKGGGSYIIPQNKSNYSFKAINNQEI